MTVRTCRDCPTMLAQPYARYCDACRWRHRRKPATHVLTPERDAYLRTHYQPTTRGISARIASVLQVPKWRVCRWAAELGLTGQSHRGPDWTPDEDRFLDRHLTTRHVSWIGRQLGRSITAVQVRAKRLQLSRLPDGYSQLDVAAAFGVSRDTVERWQRRGWLTSRFQPRDGQPYRFTDAECWQFIATHRTAFTLAKCDQTWLLGLLLDDDLRKVQKTA